MYVKFNDNLCSFLLQPPTLLVSSIFRVVVVAAVLSLVTTKEQFSEPEMNFVEAPLTNTARRGSDDKKRLGGGEMEYTSCLCHSKNGCRVLSSFFLSFVEFMPCYSSIYLSFYVS